jgi:branched-chain amino acid transport system permease protein
MIINFALFVQALVDGLIMGGIYALVAIGLTLIFGVMKIVNFTHGDFLMIAMYTSFFLHYLYKMDPYLSIFISAPLLFILGILVYRIFIYPVVHSVLNGALVTIGLSLIFQNSALLLFSGDYRLIEVPYQYAKIEIGPIIIGIQHLIAFIICFTMTLFFYKLLRSTKVGFFIRAAAEDRDAARLAGVNVEKVYLYSFGIGVASLGVVGPLLAPIYYTTPTVGTLFNIKAFIIVVLGGMGSIFGATLGGLMIGVVEAIGSVFLPGSLAPLISFFVFILLLLFKPTGLFGEKF